VRAAGDLLLPIGLMAVLFILSAIPGSPDPGAGALSRALAWTPPALQNLVHLPIYGLLAWLWCRALARVPGPPALAPSAALLLTLGYAGLDEWHQAFVPGRFASASDLALDGTGAMLAVALFRLAGAGGRRTAHGA